MEDLNQKSWENYIATLRAFIPHIVLLLSLLLTISFTVYFYKATISKDQLRFQNSVFRATKSIDARFDTYRAILRAGRGLFYAKKDLSKEEFRLFVSSLGLSERYPGIQGVGFAKRLKAGEANDYVNQIKKDGVIDFKIMPEGKRDEYYPIVYIEPMNYRNLRAIGYDMYSEPIRRAAMKSARDKGRAVISSKVTLIQETDEKNKQAGFLIYMPIYRDGENPSTVEERRSSLVGFIYSPFRVDDFIEGIFKNDTTPDIAFDIYDGEEIKPEALLHKSIETDEERRRASFSSNIVIEQANGKWTLVINTLPVFDRGSNKEWTPFVFFGGLAVSFILFGITYAQWRARALAEQVAEDLRKSEKERNRLLVLEQDARRNAEEASRAKDEFLAVVSHELRTPLNAIVGWSRMLRSGKLDEKNKEKALETINRNVGLQTRLIEDLLDISRIISGKLKLNVKQVNMVSVVESALDVVMPSAQAKGIKFTSVLDTNIGLVSGDPERLQQIVWNLLANAIKFTPKGGHIHAELRRVSSHIEVIVSDTGKGISSEFLPFIFQKFSQADTSITRKYGGLGLGLAIVRHLAEMHGGTIEAQSEGEGKGAVFILKLPIAAVILDKHTNITPSHSADSNNHLPEYTASFEGLKIIVVDDEPDTREMVKYVLEQCGAIIKTCNSVRDCLEVFKEWRPHLLISDIGMPDEDGYSLITKIRTLPEEEGGKVYAIALTAYARVEDRLRALNAGYHIQLTKPVEPGELIAVVADLTEQSKNSS